MRLHYIITTIFATAVAVGSTLTYAGKDTDYSRQEVRNHAQADKVQLGPRPFFSR